MIPDRIADKIDIGDCWLWTGARNPAGYGNVWYEGKKTGVHRLVYTLLVGPPGDEEQIDHLCRTPLCCNPDHLEPVTRQENLRRRHLFHSNKTHCKNGHEYTEENTYRWKSRRNCRTCNRLAKRKKKDTT